MSCQPKDDDYGIQFIRKDLGHEVIPAQPEFLSENLLRATRLLKGGASVDTPEHLLAALYAMGISNVSIEMDAPEVPIMDGSAKPFLDAILSVGIQEQTATQMPIIIKEPIIVGNDDTQVLVLPDTQFKVSYILEYENTPVGNQCVHYLVDPLTFEHRVAEARTFGFEHEIESLRKAGLAKGGRPGENGLLIGATDYLTPPRFSKNALPIRSWIL